MRQKTVYVAHGAFLGNVISMFISHGWKIATADKAEFLCLTGGGDISPQLYGETPLKGTYFSRQNDEEEIELIKKFTDKPKIGICRGGQLLNVVVGGGKMFQDVNNHGGTHKAYDTRTGHTIRLSSIHHQMMIPGDKGVILTTSAEATRKSAFDRTIVSKDNLTPIGNDPECIYYKDAEALCFQPHPEIGPVECTDYFFDLIDECFFEAE